MTLSDADVERYSRQIIVSGIGARGQARLCAARVAVVGAEEGCRVATLYVRALGCVTVALGAPADCIIVAGAAGLDSTTLGMLARPACPIVWYALDGTNIRSGVVDATGAFDASLCRETHAAGTEVMHAIAACDAVAGATALILGWEDAQHCYAAELA